MAAYILYIIMYGGLGCAVLWEAVGIVGNFLFLSIWTEFPTLPRDANIVIVYGSALDSR